MPPPSAQFIAPRPTTAVGHGWGKSAAAAPLAGRRQQRAHGRHRTDAARGSRPRPSAGYEIMRVAVVGLDEPESLVLTDGAARAPRRARRGGQCRRDRRRQTARRRARRRHHPSNRRGTPGVRRPVPLRRRTYVRRRRRTAPTIVFPLRGPGTASARVRRWVPTCTARNLLVRASRARIARRSLCALHAAVPPDAGRRAGLHSPWGTRTAVADVRDQRGGRARTRGSGRELPPASARDVTRQRQLERQLQQNDRLDRLGQMAGSTAHDFNNMLQGIEDGPDADHAQRAVRRGRDDYLVADARTPVERGQALTRQLLEGRTPCAGRDADPRTSQSGCTHSKRLLEDRRGRSRPRDGAGQHRRAARAGQPPGSSIRPDRTVGKVATRCPRVTSSSPRAERVTDVARLTVTDTGAGRSARAAGPDLSAVLHHEGRGSRHRPRAREHARLRAAVQRHVDGGEPARAGSSAAMEIGLATPSLELFAIA